MKRHLLITSIVLLTAPACAFVEDAAQVVIGAENGLPRVDATAQLDADHVNNALRLAAKRLEIPGEAVEPWLLDSEATWGDLRSTLCGLWSEGVLPWPMVDVDVKSHAGLEQVRGLMMRLEVPVGVGGEDEVCLDAPLSGEMRVEFAPFAVEDVATLEKQFGDQLATLADAVVQIRFVVGRFEFGRQNPDVPADSLEPSFEPANNMLSDFHLAIVEPDIIDDPRTPFEDGWLELVPYFLLDTISEEEPQRFELDPDSPVTSKIRQLLQQPPSTWAEASFTVEARATLSDEAMLSTPLAGSGISLWAQPEIVVDGLEVLGL